MISAADHDAQNRITLEHHVCEIFTKERILKWSILYICILIKNHELTKKLIIFNKINNDGDISK